jgi:hypothetical protein
MGFAMIKKIKTLKASKFRIAILLILTPLLTWYSKQAANNPWRMRSSYYIDSESVVFFQENNKGKSEEFRVFVPLDSASKEISNLSIHGWKIVNRKWGISAKSGDTTIVFSFGNTQDFGNLRILCDVLISSGDLQKLNKERLFFRPKLTVWFAQNNEESPARNVYVPRENEKVRIVRARERLEARKIE